MDTLSEESRRKNMSAIKGSNTKLETKVSGALWHKGIRFRRNVGSLYGRPDIAIQKYKVAIFIDSCFWHACPKHCKIPETNHEFWSTKLERNQQRDREVSEYYWERDWTVLRVWEHSLKDDFDSEIERLVSFIRIAKAGQSRRDKGRLQPRI